MVRFTSPIKRENGAQRARVADEQPVIDLVESGGGMWKISSLPAINYCLANGARLRRLAGVSGGSLITGLLAAGVTLEEMVSALPHAQKVGFLDAFQIPTRLREVFPHRLTTENRAGRLPKRRDLRLGEIRKDLSIVCARLDVSGSIRKVMQRVGDALRGTTFRSLLMATGELTAFLRGMHIKEMTHSLVEKAQIVELSPRLTPELSLLDAIAASCAFFISYRVAGEDLYDGFYFTNLPTRAVVEGRRRAHVLAHQTDPFMGNSWTNWLLHRFFNREAISILRRRFTEDEELANQNGVLLCPRVQELASPFSATLSPALISAGQRALAAQRFQIDNLLLKRPQKKSA